MKFSVFVLCLAAAAAAHAQTASKPTPPAAKSATPSHSASTAGVVKLPPNVPVVHGVVKTMFSLRYEDIRIGTGPEAVPQKLYKVKYTGWRAADGVKFDSWDEHRQPAVDAEGKPETDADGKPKMADPQPAIFPVGIGRMIPGFDQGFNGMHVGGKRRLFIPWQLAYGTRAMPDRGPDHPGIPAKSDLIFDVELVAMEDLPMGPHPGVGAPGAPSGAGAHPAVPPAPGSAPSSTPGSAPGSAPSGAPSGQPATPPPAEKPATPPQS